GREHPLTALLGGLVVGFMAGCNTLKSVVVFLRERPRLRHELGFTSRFCPSRSTYHRLRCGVELGAVRQALGQWLSQLAAQRKVSAAAIDGKALRASARHVLHVFAQDFWRLLDLFEVDAKKNEDSALREEIATICERYPFLQIFTLDAGFASRPPTSAPCGRKPRKSSPVAFITSPGTRAGPFAPTRCTTTCSWARPARGRCRPSAWRS